ncbi:anti-sigma factor family protein [Rhodococcus jostii]|uniref:Putative zinc-finger n=1 Tax=Rhodococcus jostii TaxID=132919 RepID=A0A1H5CWU5_RHOJO|nr:zf-HC2 domain-containing protein [Rhodococcus jostii]SED71033.1 Putative zinc-finger [Rhodococcus jostii]
MDCQDLVELVTAYLEDGLDPTARDRFETHLGICPGCANYLEQMEQTVHTLGELPAEKLDPALRDRLLAAFREWR